MATVSEAAKVAAPGAEARLASLDAYRGFTMFWIVGGWSLVAGLKALGYNPVLDAVIYQLNHSAWEGLRYYDLIWPSFMLMVGASLPFARAKRSLTQTPRQMHWRAVKRAAILFLLGSLRTSVSSNAPTLVELSSALQPIAVAYLAAHFLAFCRPRTQAVAGGSILLGYALLLAFVPAPGVPAGSYGREANLVAAVDLAVLGRTHPGGWGTVLSTIPTISTTIAGLLLGGVLMSSRPRRAKAAVLAAAGIGCVATGLLLSLWIPVVMKLWTTSYGLLSLGCSCLLFLLFYWAIDVRGWRRAAFPFAVIGMNALAIYMGRTIVPIPRIVGVFTGGMAEQLGVYRPLVHALAVLAVEWLILYWMYRRRIFLRA